MTCPHCQKDIKFKQRTNGVCDLCKREFAFDPKGTLRLHDLRFRRVAEHVGAGGFKFTASQLGMALVRRPVVERASRGVKCFLAILGILLGVFIAIAVAQADLGQGKGDGHLKGIALGIVIAATSGVALFRALDSTSPPVPTDALMRDEILPRWQAIHGEFPRGLIADDVLASLTAEDRPRDKLRAVVVCPAREVLTSLLANGIPRDLRLGLLSLAPPADAWETSVREQLQRNPRLPVLLLHDASAEGVFLARDLPQVLGLSADHRILDLGLNPRKSIEKNRTVIIRPLTAEARDRLAREVVGADVAGSRPIRRGRAQVTAGELAWLTGGNCSPILAVPPGSLVKRLKFALKKISPKKKSGRVETEEFKSAGFMT